MACFSSRVPPVGVYLVKLALMASMAARLMLSGVGKSGSPAPKSTTSTPSRRRRSASAATFMVDDSLMRPTRSVRSNVACMEGFKVLLEVVFFLVYLQSRGERGPRYFRPAGSLP